MNLKSLMQMLNNNAILSSSQVTRSKTRLRPHPWHWRLWQNQLCVHLLFLQRVSLPPLTNLRGISWGEYILQAFIACKMCSCMRVKWVLLPSHYLLYVLLSLREENTGGNDLKVTSVLLKSFRAVFTKFSSTNIYKWTNCLGFETN